MKKTTNLFIRSLVLMMMAATVQESAAYDFGYCTDAVNRNNVFRIGSTETQGMAIRLSAEKLAALKGSTISTISAVFGSSRMTDKAVRLFIATEPNGTPLVSQTATVASAVKWQTYTLDHPYRIQGDEPCLYIGYTGEIAVGSTMLLSDFMADSEGCSYVYKDGEWVDMYGQGRGNASIRAGISDAPAMTDLMVKPLRIEGYFKAGEDYAMSGQLFNCGNTTVNSFELGVAVGDGQAMTTAVSDVTIAPGETYDFTLPEWQSPTEGTVALDMQVTKVNGGQDSAPSDNRFQKAVFCYPAKMERSILLEGFTGQACSNCPAGHKVVGDFLLRATSTPVVEVMHHSGYRADYFSMNADYDYTYFYGSSSTYAPAVMLNRAAVVEEVPVMNTSMENLAAAYNLLETWQPYASLSLDSRFDPATRQLTVSLDIYTHTDMPDGRNVANVMLVQDGLVSKQVPYGDGYQHNAVFRGVLTGNSWGVQLNEQATKAGGSFHWEQTVALPEAIFSDYYDATTLSDEQKALCTWPAVPENMRLVAYVAAFGDTPASHLVYNAVEAALGSSHTQGGHPTRIEAVEAEIMPQVMVKGGRVQVEGDYDSLQVFTLDGRTVRSDVQLPKGIYVIRVGKGQHFHTVKVRTK